MAVTEAAEEIREYSNIISLGHPIIENELKLNLYPLVGNDFIGTIWMEDEQSSNSIQTVIIVDQSLSMKESTGRLTNEILPLVLSKLSYDKSQRFHLVTFAMESLPYYVTCEEMKSLAIKTHYGTNLSPAIQNVHSILRLLDANQPIRILSISDGEVQDGQAIEHSMRALTEYLDSSNFSINSQAVRLFTSESQPDTKALCSLLQINNTTTSQLVDINAKESNENIATKIAKLFQADNFSKYKTLFMEKQIILRYPWYSKPTSQIILLPGLNLFWLKMAPKGGIMIRNSPVNVIMRNPVTLNKFHDLMEPRLAYIVDHMKILKVVDSMEANKKVTLMLKYFDTKEGKLAGTSVKYSNIDSASQKKIATFLAGIANDEYVRHLDSAVTAVYLRYTGIRVSQTIHSSDLSNGIVKDKYTKNLDFPVKAEFVREMRTNAANTKSKVPSTEIKLQLYPLGGNELIGTIWMEKGQIASSVQTVIILDQSLSMKELTGRLTNNIIPLMLAKLSFDESQPVHLLTIAEDIQHYFVTAEEMKSLKIKTHSGSKWVPAVQKIHSFFKSLNTNEPIRVLTISDGQLEDHQETQEATMALVEFLDSSHFAINSQVVRLFMSNSPSDTKTLCSLLLINNTTTAQLVDIDAEASNESIATIISDLYQSDNFSSSESLIMEEQIILKFPWSSKPSTQLNLFSGQNIFWLNKVPSGGIKLRNSTVKVNLQNPLILAKFQDLMQPKLAFIVDHIQVLKIVGTIEATKKLILMIKYFESKETDLAQKHSIGRYLLGNSAYRKKISAHLAEIANDENEKSVTSAGERQREMGKKQSENTLNRDYAERAEFIREMCKFQLETTAPSDSRSDRTRRIGNIKFDCYCISYVIVFIIILILVVLMVHDLTKSI